ncbi:MAG: 50S ribosomal protein L6 [Candidatus Pacearchaeota archaeon]
MKKEIYQEIKIPENVEVEINENKVRIKGPLGEIERSFDTEGIELKTDNNKIIIGDKKATKNKKKKINTIKAHIKNMIMGVQKKFEYKLKICFNHFPITVEIKGKEAFIKNFLGERAPRVTPIPDGVDVEIDKDIIIVRSIDKELAGQTAANFEIATKIRNKDRRIFQDGIFIISKAGEDSE